VAERTGEPSGWQRRRKRIALDLERTALELFATQGVEAVTVSTVLRD
jgi:hypothetical protein